MNPDDSLITLIYGGPATGKTPIACTAPGPLLVLDVEGRTRLIRNRRKIIWRPLEEAVPAAPTDGEWDMCVVYCRDWDTYTAVQDYLVAGVHPFAGVVLDSLTELQARCKAQVMAQSRDGKMTEALWGTMLDRMCDAVRVLRDTTTDPRNPLRAVVLTAAADEIRGKIRPLVQGALSKHLPMLMDVIGYLWQDEESQGVTAARLSVTATADIEAKDSTRNLDHGGITGLYGGTVPGPIDLTEIMHRIYADPTHTDTQE